MYKPVVNMSDINACSDKALIMKDMGNGHVRPLIWGTTVTIVSGTSEAPIVSGMMAGVYVDDCVYTLSNGNCYIDKDSSEHSVKVKNSSGNVSEDTKVDVIVFMSTATTVNINDYVGKRGYQSGNY